MERTNGRYPAERRSAGTNRTGSDSWPGWGAAIGSSTSKPSAEVTARRPRALPTAGPPGAPVTARTHFHSC
jgi:hypothetical protein